MCIVKRTISSILLLAVFLIVCVNVCFASEAALKIKWAPVNPAYLAFMEEAGRKTPETRSGAAAGGGSSFTGYVPSKIDWSHLKEVSYSLPQGRAKRAQREEALPVSYDLRGTGLLTPVKNQGNFGTCWTFSAMAAAESNLIKNGLADGSIDLSEWYLSYFAFNEESAELPAYPPLSADAPYYMQGGEDWKAAALLSRGTGPVLESDAPYPQAAENISRPSVTARRYKLKDELYLGYAGDMMPSLKGERVALLKRALMRYGALSIGVHQGDWKQFFNPQTAALYRGEDQEVNGPDHAVTMVGWNDAYPKENFAGDGRPVPDADGAWIVRNSWSEAWGEAGYYYVSYEEPSLSDGVAYCMTDAVAGETVYQHDPLGMVAFVDIDGWYDVGAGPQTTVWFANIFQAQRAGTVGSIAFYTPMPNTVYEATLYRGVDPQRGPASGRPAGTAAGTLAAPGYNTVDLPFTLHAAAGESFSVVVKVTMDYEYPIPAGYGLGREANCCWVSEDGETWADFSALYDDEDENAGEEESADTPVVCLKAFGVADGSEAEGGGGGSGCAVLPFPAALLLLPALAVPIRGKK